MTNDKIIAQAAELERLMPQIARRIFTLHPDDPASELPVAQLRVCSVLQSGPATMSDLGDELGISMSAVTQIADRLERAGLVDRISDADDRRIKKLILTKHGEEVMQARVARRVERVSSVLEALSEKRRCEVLQAYRDMLAASQTTMR